MNAFLRLRQQRLAMATRPFQARGGSIIRCDFCGLAQKHCACDLKPSGKPNAAFCLLMYDTEPMKPSNTGRLIADVFPEETYAFLWSRTSPDPKLLELLVNPLYEPVVVFPESYVREEEKRLVITDTKTFTKIPLYILLDGTWSEARKMFRKSPYLDKFPVVSVTPETLSDYKLRVSAHDNQLCTAEVAICLLDQQGDNASSDILSQWFALFRERYLLTKSNRPEVINN